MQTFYLLLPIRPGESPSLIKRCHAETKNAAASMFVQRLNSLLGSEAFTEQELLPAIKQEDELTEREYQWMRETAPEMLEL